MLACINTWTLSTRDCQRITMIGTNHLSSEHRRWRISSVLRYSPSCIRSANFRLPILC
jgi:hypothetical protein